MLIRAIIEVLAAGVTLTVFTVTFWTGFRKELAAWREWYDL